MEEEVTLIFVGQETGWYLVGKEGCGSAERHQHHERHSALPNQRSRPANILVRGAPKTTIEPIEKCLQRPTALALRTQQERGQRRAEREGVKRGKNH